MTKDLSLHSSLTLNNGIRIINRFFKSAMSEQLGTYKHEPSQALFNLYKTWSLGGTGLMMTGNVMIDRQALGEPGNIVLDNQSPLHLFEQWAESAKSGGTLCYSVGRRS